MSNLSSIITSAIAEVNPSEEVREQEALEFLGMFEREHFHLRSYAPNSNIPSPLDKSLKAEAIRRECEPRYDAFLAQTQAKKPEIAAINLFKPGWFARWRKPNQNKHQGVYFVVNEGGNSDKDIQDCAALFFESDDSSLEEQAVAIESLEAQLGKQLSAVAKTRKSLHSYLLLDKPLPSDDWKKMQQRLIQHMESDRKICNPSRVMRIPGFDHIIWDYETQQPIHTPVRLLQKTDSTFTHEELDAILPEWDEALWMKSQKKSQSKPKANRVQFDVGMTLAGNNPLSILNLLQYANVARGDRNDKFIRFRCPVHIGTHNDHHAVHTITGEWTSFCDCDHQEVYAAVLELAIAGGFQHPKLLQEEFDREHRENMAEFEKVWAEYRAADVVAPVEPVEPAENSDSSDSEDASQATLTEIKGWMGNQDLMLAQFDRFLEEGLSEHDVKVRLAATIGPQHGAHYAKLYAEHQAKVSAESAALEAIKLNQHPRPALNQILPADLADKLDKYAEDKALDPRSSFASLLGFVAMAIGNSTKLRTVNSWTNPAIIYAFNMANTSGGKSEGLKPVMERREVKEAAAFSQYKKDLADYKRKIIEWNRSKELRKEYEGDALLDPACMEEPKSNYRVYQNATPEAVLMRISELNPGAGCLLLADEAQTGLGFKTYNKESAGESIFTELWNGSSAAINRKQISESYYIETPRFSVVAGCQMELAMRFLDLVLDPQGFAARFDYFFCEHPHKLPSYSDTYEEHEALYDEIEDMLNFIEKLWKGAGHVLLSDEGKVVFRELQKHYLERVINEKNRNKALASLLYKSMQKVSRKAFLLHAIECFYDRSKDKMTLTPDTLLRAAHLENYSIHSFQLVQSYNGVQGEEKKQSKHDILLDVIKGRCEKDNGTTTFRAIKKVFADRKTKSTKLTPTQIKSGLQALLKSEIIEWDGEFKEASEISLANAESLPSTAELEAIKASLEASLSDPAKEYTEGSYVYLKPEALSADLAISQLNAEPNWRWRVLEVAGNRLKVTSSWALGQEFWIDRSLVRGKIGAASAA